MTAIRLVDERDIMVVTPPIFRVWKVLDPDNRSVEVLEVTGMSLHEVLTWADQTCDHGYSLSIARPVVGGIESTWLVGRDPNDSRDVDFGS